MKKLLVFISLVMTVALTAQTVSYPSSKAQPDSVLHALDYRLQKNSSFISSDNGTTTQIRGLSSTSLSFDDLASIIGNGGTIENYLLILKVPVGFENELVHTNLPDRLNAFGDPIPYAYYFKNGNVAVRGDLVYIQLVNYLGHVLSGSEVVKLATQAMLWNGNIGVVSDYILLINDSEINGLF